MPFERPTLATLINRFRADVRSYTEGGDALLRRSVERALARVIPGYTHGLHGHVAWAARQLLPRTCEDAGVLRWASMLGLSLIPAEPAICTAAKFATTGPTIPLDTLVQRADGVRYKVTAESVAAGYVTVELEAELAGTDGNADPPTIPLELVAPIAGVDSEGEVTDPDGIHDGTDVESVEALRLRVLQRLGHPPRGGGPGDYVGWALEVAGVTRAWETPRVDGPGTVGVQFVTDVDGVADPTPSGAKVTEVTNYIAARAPSTVGRSIGSVYVGVVVTAPTADPIDPEIQLTPDDTDTRNAVIAELEDFLRREAEPGVRIPLSRFAEAISIAAGETEHVLVSPVADITPAAGHLPVLGTPVWS